MLQEVERAGAFEWFELLVRIRNTMQVLMQSVYNARSTLSVSEISLEDIQEDMQLKRQDV